MTIHDPAPRIAVPDSIGPDVLRGFDASAPVLTLSGASMGTQWRVLLALPHSVPNEGLDTAIQARLDQIVRQMSHWDDASDLCRFNRAAPGTRATLPPDFATVISCALRIAEQSGGAFDPAIGRLTDAWGLGPRKAAGAPSPEMLEQALRHSGWPLLAWDEPARQLRQPGGLWLDLSGIAKGYAADALADMLAARGILHCLVEIGGECAGRGMRPDGDPWWVDLEAPHGFALPPIHVALHRLGVATSGDYLAGAHSIDPTTGQPAIHSTTAASVIHRTCMEADAWASALCVLPPDRAQALARERGLAARLISRDGGEWLSPALQRMCD